jgi:bifunctional enzyme CysN/CysC
MTEVAPLIRVVTCGSVDDGKSTLIGRLLAETNSVPEDVLESARWTRRSGSIIPAGEVDFSLLTDGLEAEREQGITIDVAYRHLDLLNGVRGIIADAPGHEQYTRNMAVAASTADVGILLVDAYRGVRTQTFRHLYICSMMRVETVIIAINKMDAVDFDEGTFRALATRVSEAAEAVGITKVVAIPLSALTGDFVTAHTDSMPWYNGPSLLEALRDVEPAQAAVGAPFRMPVQMVLRSGNYRGLAGTVVSGEVAVGDEIAISRSGLSTRVASILVAGREATKAVTGDAIALTLERDMDVARGDLLLEPNSTRQPNDRFSCELVWISDKPLARGRTYELISGPLRIPATVTSVLDKVDVDSGHRHASRDLEVNDIGHVEIATDSPIILDDYSLVRETGSFLLVHRGTFETAAAGMVLADLPRGVNVHRQQFDLSRDLRVDLMGHKARALWLTGLPGSGKSTIANAVERELQSRGIKTYILDGDNIRLGLSKDLGFTPEDRAENVRRVGEVARLMVDAGLVVMVCLVSPYREDRQAVRERFVDGDFIEVFVDTPLEVCMERDPKGLYRQAGIGSITNMTGVGQEYEQPLSPEVVVRGDIEVERAVRDLVAKALE